MSPKNLFPSFKPVNFLRRLRLACPLFALLAHNNSPPQTLTESPEAVLQHTGPEWQFLRSSGVNSISGNLSLLQFASVWADDTL